jgi:hypothetical protein
MNAKPKMEEERTFKVNINSMEKVSLKLKKEYFVHFHFPISSMSEWEFLPAPQPALDFDQA